MTEHDRPTLAGEGGFSLIEMLIAMTVMGIAFVALLAGMATTTASAGLHRTQAVAELELRRYVELVEGAAWDVGGSYAIPPGVPTPQGAAAPYSIAADTPTTVCAPVACGDPAVRTQIVTLKIHSTDGRVEETIQIVKRAD